MSTIASPKAELTMLATFRKNYFLENLAVRSDNSVLVTVLNQNCGILANSTVSAKPVQIRPANTHALIVADFEPRPLDCHGKADQRAR